jgi:hypothetical protein
MQAAKVTASAREPIGAWIGQMATLGQSICGDAALGHEFVHSEPHHNTFRTSPRWPQSAALRYATLEYTMRAVQ